MKTRVPRESDIRRISDRGRVVIPQELQNKCGLAKGTAVRFVDYGGVLGLVPSQEIPSGMGLECSKGEGSRGAFSLSAKGIERSSHKSLAMKALPWRG